MITVSIIIVNYNTCKLTCNCIESIYKNISSVNYEIILVDNDSKDNTVDEVKRLYPDVIIIKSDKNLGFGRANNLGAEKAKGKFLFLLNSDTILKNNPFKYFLDFYNDNKNEKIGAIGTYLVDGNGKFTQSGGTFYSMYKYLLNASRKLLSLNAKKELEFQNTNVPIDYVIGADLFIEKSLFDKLGGFDKHIFMYFEDVELCKRIANLGYQSYIVSGPHIVHFVKASSTSQFTRVYNMSSLMYCLRKDNNKYKFIMFQIGFFILKSPMLLNIKRLKDNIEYLSAIFNYKKYLL